MPLKFVVHKLKKVFLNSHFSGRNVGGWRLNWGMNHLSDALNALDEYVAAALMTSSLGGRFLVPLTVLCWMRWRSPSVCNAASPSMPGLRNDYPPGAEETSGADEQRVPTLEQRWMHG